jgi:cytochrome c oxidase subunit II
MITIVARRAISTACIALTLSLILDTEFRISVLSAWQDSTAAEPKVIEVVAKRFEFEPSTIEVTEGDRVRLLVRSADGPHGVEIKQFKVKKGVPRAKPGDSPVTIEFSASTAGTFPILCSEYCGKGHEDMKGTLVVQAKAKGAQ